ncbi:hypothetical protein [Sphingomonas sp.]|uniref:hypothetical protein n=1 Tax=Sphingomonas sp. TaxID=28214 RepID=UPI002ED84BA0
MSDTISPFFWRRAEIETVRREYPIGGAKHVAALLPNRSPSAIHCRAEKLGLRRPGARGRRASS